MLDKTQAIQQKIQVLGSWINDMKVLANNPYTNGLNVERMLRDLEGFTADLRNDVQALTDELELMDEPTEAEAEEEKKAE